MKTVETAEADLRRASEALKGACWRFTQAREQLVQAVSSGDPERIRLAMKSAQAANNAETDFFLAERNAFKTYKAALDTHKPLPDQNPGESSDAPSPA